jgi:4,5-dihydroxyphthalate decarboxylase
MSALAGRRVGVTDPAATGAAWGRIALEDEGVDPAGIEWMTGPLPSLAPRLASGDLAAVFGPLGGRDGIARAEPDHVSAERAFYARRGYHPAIHVVAVRRVVVDRSPEILSALFELLERSRRLSHQHLRLYHSATPWQLADLEMTHVLFGDDWDRGGVEENRKMVATLVHRLHQDGFLSRATLLSEIFGEFEQSIARSRVSSPQQ